MKRALLIFFVLVAAVGACFAADGDKLWLTTEVPGVSPNFEMYSGSAVAEKTQSQNSTVSVGNPTTGAVSLPINIRHLGANNVEYIRSGGKFKLTITATALTFGNKGTETPKASTISAASSENLYTISEVTGKDSNVVSFVIEYAGDKVSKGDIASWTYTWAQNESLPAATYTGTITLQFETTT